MAKKPGAIVWLSATPDAIVAELERPGFALTVPDARAVWECAAAARHANPAVSHRLTSALLSAARRLSAPIPPEMEAIVWCAHAEASNGVGRVQEAVVAYARAASSAETFGGTRLLGRILLGQVHQLALTGHTGEAQRIGRRAERLLRNAGETELLAKLYMNRGNACYQTDDYRGALREYRRAERAFARARTQDATRAGLLMNTAIACTNLERYTEARRLFLRTEELALALHLPHLQAFSWFNRAFLERLGGETREALRLLDAAASVFREQESRDMMAAASQARAEIYLELGMGEEAIDLAREAFRIFRSETMELDALLARIDEARGLRLLDRHDEAAGVLREVAARFRGKKGRIRQAFARLELADIERERGRLGTALTLAGKAERELVRAGIESATAAARRERAAILLARGDAQAAERILKPVLRRASGRPTDEALRAWSLGGRVAAARNDAPTARRRLRRAADLLELQRALLPGRTLRSASFARHGELYEDLIRLEIERPRARFETVFPLLQRARARAFGDRLQGGGARRSGRFDDKRLLLGSLVRQLEEFEFRPHDEDAGEAMAVLDGRIRSLERDLLSEERRREEAESAATPSFRDDAGSAALDALHESESLLQLFPLEGRIIALVANRRRREMSILPREGNAIQDSIARFHFHLDSMALTGDRPAEAQLEFQRRATRSALQTLYRTLLEPLEDALRASDRLLVVPHGFLHQVPFHCLHDGRCHVDERWRVSYLPNADFLARERRRRPREIRRAVVAGTTRLGLAAVAAEVEQVAASLPSRVTTVLHDPPTHDLLARMGTADLLHLSSHGFFRDDNPAFSRISTGDGALFLIDVLKRSVRSELTVLSACQTGRTFTGRGDDLAGVAFGFLAAGSRSLVASLWRVHDEATRELMRRFYHHYLHGADQDAVEALHAASRELRGDWDHPFYWGGFAVFGATTKRGVPRQGTITKRATAVRPASSSRRTK